MTGPQQHREWLEHKFHYQFKHVLFMAVEFNLDNSRK